MIELFGKADSILNEKDIMIIVSSLHNGRLYGDDQTKIAKFFDFANVLVSHSYVIGRLQKRYVAFLNALDQVGDFVGLHFYSSDIGRDRCELPEPRGEATWGEYSRLEAALDKLASKLLKSYQAYRLTVKQELVV